MKFTRALSLILALLLVTFTICSCGNKQENYSLTPEQAVEKMQALGYTQEVVYTISEASEKLDGNLAYIIYLNADSKVFIACQYADPEFAAYAADSLQEQIQADTSEVYTDCVIEQHGQWVLCAEASALETFLK